MPMIDVIAGAAGGAFASYLFQRKATIDNTVTDLENKTAVALTKLSASTEHIAKELGAIRDDMRAERAELFDRLRTCEVAITEIKAQVQYAPFCKGREPETPFQQKPRSELDPPSPPSPDTRFS